MSESVKEVKEAVLGLQELVLVLVPLLKDGVQLGDAVALMGKLQSDANLMAALKNAVDGIGKVPAEVKDLDLSEGMELAMMQIGFIPKLLEALKK